MATTSDLYKGAYFRHNNELVLVLEYDHITPGKGNTIYSVKCRNVKTGKQNEIRFRSGEKVEFVRVEFHELQYLFEEGDALVCMNQETYEQTSVPKFLLGDNIKFLQESMIVKVYFDENNEPINAELPKHIEVIIGDIEMGAGKALKTAEVGNGAKILIPLFVEKGEKVRINTETGEYLERVK
jgi:elongation factor P